MTNIIIVLSKPEDGKSLRNLLTRQGFHVVSVCTTGAQALSQAEGLLDGIVISGYHLRDMIFTELHENLPPNFEFVLMASERVINDYDCSKFTTLTMPLKVQNLVETIGRIDQEVARRHRRLKSKPRVRSKEDQDLIDQAKKQLMEHKNMSEEEAHKYMQKCSMDNATSLVETAKMLLTLRNYEEE